MILNWLRCRIICLLDEFTELTPQPTIRSNSKFNAQYASDIFRVSDQLQIYTDWISIFFNDFYTKLVRWFQSIDCTYSWCTDLKFGWSAHFIPRFWRLQMRVTLWWIGKGISGTSVIPTIKTMPTYRASHICIIGITNLQENTHKMFVRWVLLVSLMLI